MDNCFIKIVSFVVGDEANEIVIRNGDECVFSFTLENIGNCPAKLNDEIPLAPNGSRAYENVCCMPYDGRLKLEWAPVTDTEGHPLTGQDGYNRRILVQKFVSTDKTLM